MKRALLALIALCGVALSAQQPLSYEALTVAGTAVGLSAATLSVAVGGAAERTRVSKCVFSVEDASIRWRVDGTAPTSSEGHLVVSGTYFDLEGFATISAWKAIRTGSSALVRVTCFR
jgi:hypothetical protein